MKKLIGLIFFAWILSAGPALAETCASLEGECRNQSNCTPVRDLGPTDDCKAEDNKTCCQNVLSCVNDKNGSCRVSCNSNEKSIGVFDCSNIDKCCLQIETCASKGGSCKAKCGSKETKTGAEDCTGSKKYCCTPPATPSGPEPVEKKACSVLGGGQCVPKIGCSADTEDKAADTSDCDTLTQECCVPKAGTPATTAGGAAPKETKPAELKTVGAFGLWNPLGNRSVPQLLGQLVAWLGAIGGSLFFAYLMWGGVEWMTAGGDYDRVGSGRKKIIAAVSGIVVILLAYLIIESLIGVTAFQ